MITAEQARQAYLQSKDIQHDDDSLLREINGLIEVAMNYGGFRVTIEIGRLNQGVIKELRSNGYNVLFAPQVGYVDISWRNEFHQKHMIA